MGKHEAYREPALKRLLASAAARPGVLAARRLARRLIPKAMPLWGFWLTTGFVLVTVVDPYSGTMASAKTMQIFSESEMAETQNYLAQEDQVISFERGGFKIVTGGDAVAMFVQLAVAPEPGTAKAYAFEQLVKRGYGEDQYSCLVKLWTRESNWRVTAKNPSSGAYGIPQSLPAVKMATEGADYLTNHETQIRWGIKYIQSRYGSPCGALSHSDRKGWY